MKTLTLKTLFVMTLGLTLVAGAAWATDAAFPYRGDYPDLQTVESNELFDGVTAGDWVVVDVRSKLEFDVIHVDGAHHIPVSKMTFAGKVKELAAANPGKNLAFYCNGTTCLKSYKATQKAKEAGLTDVFAYDAGIPAWANSFPESTQLLGKPITDPQTQLITKARFKDHCLAWSFFQAKGAEDGVMVIDVRDKIQISGSLPGLESARNIPLDVFIPNFVAKKANQDKTLLIIDQVGKQIKWLQYYLEEYGYTDYLFLEGGATAVLKSQDYRS